MKLTDNQYWIYFLAFMLSLVSLGTFILMWVKGAVYIVEPSVTVRLVETVLASVLTVFAFTSWVRMVQRRSR
jgi:membrane protein implicated in regulation of membrane protease activity